MKCVVNFASGQQCQTELHLYFGVCVLQKFQQSSHRDGRFAFGEYSLRAVVFLFGIEPFLELPAQLYTRGLLDMSDGLGSGSLCSDKKVKNLLRLLREPSWNSK